MVCTIMQTLGGPRALPAASVHRSSARKARSPACGAISLATAAPREQQWQCQQHRPSLGCCAAPGTSLGPLVGVTRSFGTTIGLLARCCQTCGMASHATSDLSCRNGVMDAAMCVGVHTWMRTSTSSREDYNQRQNVMSCVDGNQIPPLPAKLRYINDVMVADGACR